MQKATYDNEKVHNRKRHCHDETDGKKLGKKDGTAKAKGKLGKSHNVMFQEPRHSDFLTVGNMTVKTELIRL